jgi:hypothetical protein
LERERERDNGEDRTVKIVNRGAAKRIPTERRKELGEAMGFGAPSTKTPLKLTICFGR